LSRRFLAILLAGGVLLAAGCGVAPRASVLNHSPSAAAAIAQRYVDLLLVRKDADAAYGLVDADARARVSVETLQEAVAKAPGYGQVTSVQAVEYQPVPGQPAMDIFLTGSAGGRTFYYAVRLSGTRDEGYLVNDLSIESEPFRASSLRESLQ